MYFSKFMKYDKNNTFLHKNGHYMPKLNCYVNQKGHLLEGNFWVSIITIVKFLKKCIALVNI